ncbi:hypothetical protein LTR53_016060 [Teratosphaeriaceae sp. CCFEE 6253]|nr:hypothetical protein LTR53_016060 [Teratosphaeriaceae sp. CCFEE 6253]
MFDARSGIEVRVKPHGSPDAYHEWVAKEGSTLYAAGRNEAFIEAVTDERFEVEIIIHPHFSQLVLEIMSESQPVVPWDCDTIPPEDGGETAMFTIWYTCRDREYLETQGIIPLEQTSNGADQAIDGSFQAAGDPSYQISTHVAQAQQNSTNVTHTPTNHIGNGKKRMKLEHDSSQTERAQMSGQRDPRTISNANDDGDEEAVLQAPSNCKGIDTTTPSTPRRLHTARPAGRGGATLLDSSAASGQTHSTDGVASTGREVIELSDSDDNEDEAEILD